MFFLRLKSNSHLKKNTPPSRRKTCVLLPCVFILFKRSGAWHVHVFKRIKQINWKSRSHVCMYWLTIGHSLFITCEQHSRNIFYFLQTVWHEITIPGLNIRSHGFESKRYQSDDAWNKLFFFQHLINSNIKQKQMRYCWQCVIFNVSFIFWENLH